MKDDLKNNPLRVWMKNNGHTWESFAGEIGMSRRGIYAILSGESKDIFVTTCDKIYKLTGLGVDDYAPHILRNINK